MNTFYPCCYHFRVLCVYLQTGGVASTTDIIGEVRQQHRRIRLQQLQQQQSALGEAGSGVVSGPGTNVDRRTIERTLQRLEHVMHRVVSCSAAAQSAETSAAETLALVALTDMDDQQRAKAVEDYLLARAVKIESTVPDLLNSSATSLDPPALLSQTKKRLAEASAGTKPQRGKAAETMVSSASKARKRRRRADSGSDSENEYSLSQSSPHTSSSSSEDSDSDSGGVASDRGKPTRKRLTREDIAVTRTTEGVDQRKARHNAINQKKVQHDAHIFDSTGLLPTTEHYEALRHQHSDDNGALLRLAEVESPGFFVQCMLFHNFLQQCVVKTVSSHTSASAAVGQGRRGSSATATFLHAGEQVEVLLPALLLNFPVHFFLRTSAAMRKLLLEFTANNTGKRRYPLITLKLTFNAMVCVCQITGTIWPVKFKWRWKTNAPAGNLWTRCGSYSPMVMFIRVEKRHNKCFPCVYRRYRVSWAGC